ncbi:MAG: helix-turn-helix transcriptional regulator [Oscillibacter sp.]|nr:helix-turn-helix transcriptional regulator [Oscillibacter sp.]
MDLKAIRQKKGLAGSDVSMMTGISHQHYNYIENGKRRPSVEVAKRIAAALGFDWTRFYEDGAEGKEV